MDADYTKRVKVVLSQAETNGDSNTASATVIRIRTEVPIRRMIPR